MSRSCVAMHSRRPSASRARTTTWNESHLNTLVRSFQALSLSDPDLGARLAAQARRARRRELAARLDLLAPKGVSFAAYCRAPDATLPPLPAVPEYKF